MLIAGSVRAPKLQVFAEALISSLQPQAITKSCSVSS